MCLEKVRTMSESIIKGLQNHKYVLTYSYFSVFMEIFGGLDEIYKESTKGPGMKNT